MKIFKVRNNQQVVAASKLVTYPFLVSAKTENLMATLDQGAKILSAALPAFFSASNDKEILPSYDRFFVVPEYGFVEEAERLEAGVQGVK